ncbi:unnamed protein product [Owenia fusiformis]|uniref:Uncharacterized protein n=1 Tax=Owenia fusiformis TaxID=6347 RepID=A0A8J1TVL9_OWEFU|nr:unnamed protein product [Owenia fusiformis]
MELIDHLKTDKWEKADINEQKGFSEYRVCHRKLVADGHFLYMVQPLNEWGEQEGEPCQAHLHEAAGKKDPIHGINNIFFKLDGAAGDMKRGVIGVDVEGDCVIKK